jgi:magnesium-transporting ATPase (P-type)
MKNPEDDSNSFINNPDDFSSEKIQPKLQILIGEKVKEEIKKEIAIDKATLFSVFGVFASIVTFLSVEIQSLKIFYDFWNILGFNLVMLASLLIFVLLLDYIGRGWRNDYKIELKKFPWIIFIIITIIFILGLILPIFANELGCKENLIFKRYEKDFTKRQVELEELFDKDLKDIRFLIQKQSEQIKSLENNHNK